MRRSAPFIASSLALALLAAACTSGTSGGSASNSSAAATTSPATTTTVALPLASFTVQPGMNQVAVLGATAGDNLEIVGADGTVAGKGVADEQGSFLQRTLASGTYVVRTTGSKAAASKPVEVYDESKVPPASFYSDQKLPAGGFGYLTVRDGTTLSVNVMLPGPADKGPYPTIVEYSGYQPSDPDSNTFGQLFNALGYAYVGVNMRGTGCSGGSYLFFERQQSVDGYDAVEAVAAQPWVMDHKVGMGGISYPGITQLFVAETTPPSLEAIAPLSVIDDFYRGNGYPGGILNSGFAAAFLKERFDEAKVYGQKWTKKRADAGDTVCAENQKLRLQNPDFLALTKDNIFYNPAVADAYAPVTFVNKINVPVFMAGAWQDEQTGGHFPEMISHFTSSPHLYVDLVNGLHTESLSPTVFVRMVEFYSLYVAKKTPTLAGARVVAPILVPGVFKTATPPMPADRFAGQTYQQALAAFEAEPPVRVLFEEGASGQTVPSGPLPRWTQSFPTWPIPSAKATTWYLSDKGLLSPDKQTAGTPDSYTADPTALPKTFYDGGESKNVRSSDVWAANVVYSWLSIPSGTGVGYATAPLKADTVVVGTGSADLWVKSSAADTDFEVTVTEVRPDGTEMYVQSGWLRASHRALDAAKSTDVLPVQTHLQADAAPLPADTFTPVRIEIFPVAYAFRAGSRIRITIDAPGNSRPVWSFDTIDKGETDTIAHDSAHPSAIVLSVIPDVTVPPGVPACGSLRGEPCHAYAPLGNETAAL
jgi:predicted acyl esterase